MNMQVYTGTVIVCLVFTVCNAGRTGPLSGHSVVRITPRTEYQLKQIVDILENHKSVDVWKYPSFVNGSVDVRVSPHNRDGVTKDLLQVGLGWSTLIPDVQTIMDEQTAERERSKVLHRTSGFDYSHYHTLDEIHDWLDNITNVYKDKTTIFNVTSSYEGRPLLGLKISTQPQNAKNIKRPSFWIEGGIHAREWISPATVIYMAGQMLDQYKTDPELAVTVDEFDWYILPVTNPDGYVYTWNGDDKARLWRKTRSKNGKCIGVDPNRNWDCDWCAKGASKDPCSDTYCGPKAFSESEVKGVADYIEKIGNVKAFIDFHSYSQMWMSPYGYTEKLPPDFKVQDTGSILAIGALAKLYGTEYTHGTLARTVYISSGSSADWTYKVGIKFSYGVELRDTGKFGFLLPEAQILPSGLETLAGLKSLADFIAKN